MGSVMTGGDLEDGMGFFFSKYNLLESKHQYSKKKIKIREYNGQN